MKKLIRKLDFKKNSFEELQEKEWIVTNGLGGYASGTLNCVPTRRYHGYLIAASSPPIGRVMMLNNLNEVIRIDAKSSKYDSTGIQISGMHLHEESFDKKTSYLTEFRLENGLPFWKYQIEDTVIEKKLIMPHLQNTTYIMYHLLSQKPVELLLRPSVELRPHGKPFTRERKKAYTFSARSEQFEIFLNSIFPSLRFMIEAERYSFIYDNIQYEHNYVFEAQAGYDSSAILWSPGYFHINLNPGCCVCLVASTEKWNLKSHEAFESENIRRSNMLESAKIKTDFGLELALAADQFLIFPKGRNEDLTRANALGDQVRTVIAGYHWFTDWGRDTMISLEGLTQMTGRIFEAGWILKTFSQYIRNGLIPNMFPEERKQGLYQTADATLWFFHAFDRYIEASRDILLLHILIPKFVEIIDAHFRGTLFGIGVDLNDGLLKQGHEGTHLTWMDAQCGDWIVTPRRGKTVEINALWYNALCLIIKWLQQEKIENPNLDKYVKYAEMARKSFNERFWYQKGGYLYDIVDGENGDDASLRPNQIFAISLPNAVLEEKYWQPVLDIVQSRLLTPFGLRSLSSDNPEYKAKYFGDLRSRDAAYHQGTVWTWLIGPFIDAFLKKNPNDKAKARDFLKDFEMHLNQSCIGTISEIFDAEKPFISRGCISQAWSVAEVLRSLHKTLE
jgi:predicted glycogen debranching enzyme